MFPLKRFFQSSLIIFLLSPMAWAQSSRVWVSGVGDDTYPCSRTAPCKTFAAALTKVADGGEINALDAGSYDSVTINKSVTIDGGGTLASIFHPSRPIGVIIWAASTANVTLRNLSVDGGGTGMMGIQVNSAGRVVLENVVVMNELSSPGYGIQIGNSSSMDVSLRNCAVSHNANVGISADGGGIGVKVSIEHSRIDQTGYAVEANNMATLTISDSSISQNLLGVTNDSTSAVHIHHSTLSQNRFAVMVGGPLVVSACQITANEIAFIPGAGDFEPMSHGNNAIIGNGDIGMTPIVIGLQ